MIVRGSILLGTLNCAFSFTFYSLNFTLILLSLTIDLGLFFSFLNQLTCNEISLLIQLQHRKEGME